MIGWQKKFQINVQKLQLIKFNKSVAAGNFSAFFIKSEWNYSFTVRQVWHFIPKFLEKNRVEILDFSHLYVKIRMIRALSLYVSFNLRHFKKIKTTCCLLLLNRYAYGNPRAIMLNNFNVCYYTICACPINRDLLKLLYIYVRVRRFWHLIMHAHGNMRCWKSNL